jgi:hypothetical protein
MPFDPEDPDLDPAFTGVNATPVYRGSGDGGDVPDPDWTPPPDEPTAPPPSEPADD